MKEETIIDNIRYNYVNKANSYRIRFSEDSPTVYMEAKGKALKFELSEANASNVISGGDPKQSSISDYDLTGRNYITYKGVFNNTDLTYQVVNGVLKEYLVINDSSSPRNLGLDLAVPDLMK